LLHRRRLDLLLLIPVNFRKPALDTAGLTL
jgi:hypothetical protein